MTVTLPDHRPQELLNVSWLSSNSFGFFFIWHLVKPISSSACLVSPFSWIFCILTGYVSLLHTITLLTSTLYTFPFNLGINPSMWEQAPTSWNFFNVYWLLIITAASIPLLPQSCHPHNRSFYILKSFTFICFHAPSPSRTTLPPF